MSDLERMGVKVKRSFESSSTSINGMQLSANETTKLELALPRDTGVQATFSKEGIGAKVAKIFKKELQTGDRAFDDAVFIKTATTEATEKLLKSARVREIIALSVSTAGPVEIDHGRVHVTLVGRRDDEDPEVVALVKELLEPSA
jgi:hypothetical protein